MVIVYIILCALLLDYLLGEPKSYHPIVGLGKLIIWVESLVRRPRIKKYARLRGIIGLCLVTIPILVACLLAEHFLIPYPIYQFIFSVLVLYIAIAPDCLKKVALSVGAALSSENLEKAREQVSLLVSRDTANLTEQEVCRAAVESVLENGSDAVYAPIFWFVCIGPVGVVLHRVVNTLDAMWGYKNEEYLYFGWAAARLDDLLNYIPSRLTALIYSLLGDFKQAMDCWRNQATLCESPNAGPVMTAGAGSLRLKLGGSAMHEGVLKNKPVFGAGNQASPNDITRAVRLVERGIVFSVLVIFLFSFFYGVSHNVA